jgi:serine/threonine protein phosphatase PrpC
MAMQSVTFRDKSGKFVSKPYVLNPTDPTQVFAKHSSETSFARIEGASRKNFLDHNKDSFAVFTSEELVVVAICDGSMNRGAYFSSTLASLLVEHTLKHEGDPPTLSILPAIAQSAINNLFDLENVSGKKGDALSTMTLVTLFPDGTYHAIAVGDSPLFRFSDGDNERHFDYKNVLIRSSDGSNLIKVRARSLPLEAYEASFRNTAYVGYDVEGGVVSFDFEYGMGKLKSGSKLLLATDGLTKLGIHEISLAGPLPLIKTNDQILDWGSIVSTYSDPSSSLEHLFAVVNQRSYRHAPLHLAKTEHCFRVHDDVTCVLIEKK